MKSTGKVGRIRYTLLISRANRRITIRVGLGWNPGNPGSETGKQAGLLKS